MEHNFKTKGVCASMIHFKLDDENKLHDVKFDGGCNGNLKAIGILVEDMPAEEVIKKLKGNICGMKNTSCADQLAIALEEATA